MRVILAQDEPLQELLLNMLEINPQRRWSAARCLQSNYFDDIRQPSIEKGASSKLLLDIDKTDAFDYNQALSEKYTRKDYLAMIWKEC
jgi:serine/threonine protein kinase